ncbi:MAG: hypothetical protein ACK2TV_06695, partial [Anaerolineales bacterium]
MYDLNIIPIRHKNGKQLSEWPGFLAVNPPRRAVRSRADDILVLSLILSKDERLSSHEQSSLLEHLTQDFYKTPGSVTSALRALIETLNLTMMENNLKFARSGIATTGAINLAAIHRQSIYIVQSGLTHAYILTKQGLQHFYDASQMDRGLGLSRSPDLHYYQADLDQGGYLFMTDTPPETWTEDQLLQGTF